MNFEPFFKADSAIQIHAIAAVSAFVLGAIVLWRRKGGRVHKVSGRIWVALMMITALSGFFIHEIRIWGDYSPIHVLSAAVPVMLVIAILSVRNGNISRHRRLMQGTYAGGMLAAGGATFLPGRLNHEILFGAQTGASLAGRPETILAVLLLIGLASLAIAGIRPRQS